MFKNKFVLGCVCFAPTVSRGNAYATGGNAYATGGKLYAPGANHTPSDILYLSYKSSCFECFNFLYLFSSCFIDYFRLVCEYGKKNIYFMFYHYPVGPVPRQNLH